MGRSDDFCKSMGKVSEWVKQRELNKKMGLPVPFEAYKARTWTGERLELVKILRKVGDELQHTNVRNIYYAIEALPAVRAIVKKLTDMSLARAQKEGKIIDPRKGAPFALYTMVKNLCTDARNAGVLAFSWFEDHTREVIEIASWKRIEDAIEAGRCQFRRCYIEMDDQVFYVEVWLEKRALQEKIRGVVNFFGLKLVPCGGNNSTTLVYEAAQRFKAAFDRDQEVLILYLGDLNPAGKNMIEDYKRRLRRYGVDVEFVEVALNEEDVEKYHLPCNPEKLKDKCLPWFRKKYPNIRYAVELDALPTKVLREKLYDAISKSIDMEAFLKHREEDRLDREELAELLKKLWEERQNRRKGD